MNSRVSWQMPILAWVTMVRKTDFITYSDMHRLIFYFNFVYSLAIYKGLTEKTVPKNLISTPNNQIYLSIYLGLFSFIHLWNGIMACFSASYVGDLVQWENPLTRKNAKIYNKKGCFRACISCLMEPNSQEAIFYFFIT